MLFLELSRRVAESDQWVVMGSQGLRNPPVLWILVYPIFPFNDDWLYRLDCPISFRGQVNSVILSIYLLYTHIGLPHLLVLRT